MYLPIALGLGTQEAVIIIGVIVLLFGVKKLPELGKSLAEGIHEFKKASKKIKEDDEDTSETSADTKLIR